MKTGGLVNVKSYLTMECNGEKRAIYCISGVENTAASFRFSLPEGAQLTVYISLGPQPLTVPNVVGIDAQQAKTQLEAMGFVVETTEQANDGSHQEGMVASVSPDVGAASQQGETVTLSVWGAPPTSSSFQIGGNSSNGNSGGFDLGGLGNLFGLFG